MGDPDDDSGVGSGTESSRAPGTDGALVMKALLLAGLTRRESTWGDGGVFVIGGELASMAGGRGIGGEEGCGSPPASSSSDACIDRDGMATDGGDGSTDGCCCTGGASCSTHDAVDDIGVAGEGRSGDGCSG